jgi:hypothetical protein
MNISPRSPTASAGQPKLPPPDAVTDHVVREITDMFAKAQKPIVIVDLCAARFGMTDEVRKLVEQSHIRFFASKSTTPPLSIGDHADAGYCSSEFVTLERFGLVCVVCCADVTSGQGAA